MKVLTYGSYGGLAPDAVLAESRRLGADLRAAPELVAFVESFKSRDVFVDAEEIIKNNPDRLFLSSFATRNGIKTVNFLGWRTTRRDDGHVVRVAVNEYDENALLVVVEAYDGAERLEPIPEYAPVTSIPGLYERVRR